jgi:peptidylprolyl isomerase
MKTTTSFPSTSASLRSLVVLAVSAGLALPALAQTAVHHHAPVAAHSEYAGCVKLPTIAATVPALPSTAPCAKALYAITRTPDMKLDYVSPLVSPAVRTSIETKPETFSLAYIDTVVGTGEAVRPDTFLSVKYAGYLVDGKKFDASDDHPNKEPITFQHGEHRVIEGWDTGFEGMHVGGKRRLFIPYQLAYGEAGRPPVIPAKSELIFDVEVVSQSDKAPEPKTPPVTMHPPTNMPGMRPTPAPTPAHPAASSPAPAAKTPPPASTSTPPNGTAPKP